MDVKSWLAQACDIVRRNLTQDEWQQYIGSLPYRETCANIDKNDIVDVVPLLP
jgi:hypothetical protein